MDANTTPGQLALQDFERTWPQLFFVSFATRIALAVLVLPLVALVLRFGLSAGDRGALSDQEILFFFLSPVGFATLVVAGGAAIGASLLEQAGLQSVGFGASHGRRVTWVGALRHVGRELPTILVLGGHVLVRLLIMVVPLVLLVGAAYLIFLGEHDINYYMTNRPPEYVRALIVAGVLVVAWAAFAVPRMLGWIYALPIVLFENVGPGEALDRSAADVEGHRWELVGWLLAWFVLGWLVAAVATWALGLLGRLLIPESGSAALVAFSIGTVGVATIATNLLISFVSLSLLALLIVRLYERHRDRAIQPDRLYTAGDLGIRARLSIDRKDVLWGGVAALGIAGLAAWFLLSHVEMEDDALIIAHRGAAAHAPENTMAAIARALDDETDFVEIDVQETADGEVVVFHDSDFMKTAGDPMPLWEARRTDIERIDIGTWFDPSFAGERPPTLEEVLLAARGRAKVDIELKYYGHDQDLERKVIEIVETHGMANDVVVMSLKYDKVLKFKELRPRWTYGLLTTVDLGDATTFDVDFLAVNTRAATRRFIRRAHAAGRDVYVWTVNDPFQMSSMMSRGVDGIITDDPGLARRVLEFRRGLNPAERLLVAIGTEAGALSLPRAEAEVEDA